MTYTSEVAADNPDIYYRLGDAVASTTVADSSGNAVTGAVQTTLFSGAASTVTFGQTGLVGDSDTAALFGGTGSKGGVVTPASAIATTAQWFVEFVVTPQHASNWEAHFHARNVGTLNTVAEFRLNYTQARLTLFRDTPPDEYTYTPAVSLGGAQKIHVVFGIDSGGDTRIYIDGVEIHSVDLSGITFRHSTMTSTMQVDAENCIVDEIAYYNQDVSLARFQAHLAAIPVNMTASLVLPRLTATSDIDVNLILPAMTGADINIGSAAGFVDAPPTFTTKILDPDQRRAPTSLTVTVAGAYAGGRLRFYYDGSPTIYYSIPADFSGNLVATSIPVPPDMLAGAHTLTVETQSPTVPTNLRAVTLPFTLAHNPATGHVVGPDADAVEVVEAIQADGHRHWIFQDLMPDGLGSYIFTHNPVSSARPDYERRLSARRSTANNGQVHVTEAVGIKYEWRFAGLCLTEADQVALEAWAELNRRFYIIDDFGEAWVVASTNAEVKPRKRSNLRVAGGASTLTDWVAEYSFTVLVYNDDPITPVGA